VRPDFGWVEEAARRATIFRTTRVGATPTNQLGRTGMVKPKVKTIRGKIGDGWQTPFDDPIPLPRGRQM
jgi:hypothetical protein